MPIPNAPDLVVNPFAFNGDRTAPPPTSSTNFVNVSSGYTADYEIDLESGNTSAKGVERQIQNYLFYQLTGGLQAWQETSIAPWYSTMPGGYPIGAIVGRVSSGGVWQVWRSLVAGNIIDPNGASQVSWEYIPFNMELLKSVAMPAGGFAQIAPGGQTTEVISVATDFNSLTNGTWEFGTDALANSSPHSPIQLGQASSLSGMLQAKAWNSTPAGTTFNVQMYVDRSGNSFYRGAQNGTWTAWVATTPTMNFSLDSSATVNKVQGNALLASTVIADGQRFIVKAIRANTGATSFSPTTAIGTFLPVVGMDHAALQGGEIVTGGYLNLMFQAAANQYVLESSTGGAQTGATATKPNQLMTLGQAAGRILNIQYFTTAGSFTYTPSAGVTTLRIRGCGAGGGGAGGSSSAGSSAGGAAGGYFEWFGLRSALPGTVQYTVGAGGAGGAAGGGSGANGGDTFIGTTILKQMAGVGGQGSSPGAVGLGGSATVSVAGSNLTVPGQSGQGNVAGSGVPGAGGASFGSAGGVARAAAPVENSALLGSGGAGGYAAAPSTQFAGADGATGYIFIEEYS